QLRPGQNIEYIITDSESWYLTNASEPSRCGKDGLATTERSMPPCCARRSSLSNCSSQILHHETIGVRFALAETGSTLHYSRARDCWVPASSLYLKEVGKAPLRDVLPTLPSKLDHYKRHLCEAARSVAE